MAREEKPKAGGKKEEAAAAASAKKGKTMLIVIVASVITLAAGGGGAAWWFARGHGSGKAAEKQPERTRPAVYIPLETFTVNLQPENGDRYLQTTLSLSVADGDGEQAIKQMMPVIRSRLLLILSSKTPSELASVDGKQKLANQIAAEVNNIVNPGGAVPVAATTSAAEGEAARGSAPDGAAPDGAAAGAAPAPAPSAETRGPVLSVLFTNFIIQ